MQDVFSPFGWLHAAIVVVAAAGWIGLLRAARRAKKTGRETSFRRRFGAVLLVVNGSWALWLALPSHFNIDVSLPIHLCDFAWMAAAASMLMNRLPPRGHPAHDLTYYWTLGLSPLSFVTPTVTEGPGLPDFWMFFTAHWLVVGAGLLNSLVFDYRPSRSGLLRAVAVTVALAMLVTVVNLLLDTPYFFTGRGTPDNPTPLDALGPWPGRVVLMAILVVLLFVAMTPDVWRRRRR